MDDEGRLLEPTLTKTILGFIRPTIKDKGAKGTGAKLTTVYNYSGPREISEKNILQLQEYVDCVGHPMLEDEV